MVKRKEMNESIIWLKEEFKHLIEECPYFVKERNECSLKCPVRSRGDLTCCLLCPDLVKKSCFTLEGKMFCSFDNQVLNRHFLSLTNVLKEKAILRMAKESI